jgi:hypothetical protein
VDRRAVFDRKRKPLALVGRREALFDRVAHPTGQDRKTATVHQ